MAAISLWTGPILIYFPKPKFENGYTISLNTDNDHVLGVVSNANLLDRYNATIMKKILILTDHSDNAGHAGAQAARLAAKTHANLLLAHSYALIPVSPYAAVIAVPYDNFALEEQNKWELKRQAEALEKLTSSLSSEERRPSVHYTQQLSTPAELLKDLSREHDIDCVVLGESNDNAADHFLFGSDTRKILDSADQPVLIIPKEAELLDIRKVIFATDFDEHDLVALKYLINLGKFYHFELVVTNVGTPDHPTSRNKAEFFKERLEKFGYDKLCYHEIGGMDVAARLDSFCRAQHASLLGIGHRQRLFLGRIGHKSIARSVLHHKRLPVMVFPSSMKMP